MVPTPACRERRGAFRGTDTYTFTVINMKDAVMVRFFGSGVDRKVSVVEMCRIAIAEHNHQGAVVRPYIRFHHHIAVILRLGDGKLDRASGPRKRFSGRDEMQHLRAAFLVHFPIGRIANAPFVSKYFERIGREQQRRGKEKAGKNSHSVMLADRQVPFVEPPFSLVVSPVEPLSSRRRQLNRSVIRFPKYVSIEFHPFDSLLALLLQHPARTIARGSDPNAIRSHSIRYRERNAETRGREEERYCLRSGLWRWPHRDC